MNKRKEVASTLPKPGEFRDVRQEFSFAMPLPRNPKPKKEFNPLERVGITQEEKASSTPPNPSKRAKANLEEEQLTPDSVVSPSLEDEAAGRELGSPSSIETQPPSPPTPSPPSPPSPSPPTPPSPPESCPWKWRALPLIPKSHPIVGYDERGVPIFTSRKSEHRIRADRRSFDMDDLLKDYPALYS